MCNSQTTITIIGYLDYNIDFILKSFKLIKAELCLNISQQTGVKVQQRYTYIKKGLHQCAKLQDLGGALIKIVVFMGQ